MPTPFSGAAASDATTVPWNSPGPSTVWSLRKVVFGRPANSGCVGSTPLSTIVIGTPGPGAGDGSAPMRGSHHSCACSGSPAMRPVAAAAGLQAQSAAASAMSRRRRTWSSRVAIRSRCAPRLRRSCLRRLGLEPRRPERTLLDAVEALRAEPGVDVVAVSGLIETEPVGFLDQPRFVNGVVALDTTLPARALLELLLDVERRFGRSREGVPAQGPRTLDLDLLLYGDAEIDEPGLQVPHPRMHERSFVLAPGRDPRLAEIAPGSESTPPRKSGGQTPYDFKQRVGSGPRPVSAPIARLH